MTRVLFFAIFLCFSPSSSSAHVANRVSVAAAANKKWNSNSRVVPVSNGGGGGGGGGGSRPASWVSNSDPDLRLLAFEEGYDLNLPPKAVEEEEEEEDGRRQRPLKVEVSLNLRNIFEVNEIAQLVTMETTLRLYWTDPRVRLRDEAVVPDGEEYLTLNPRLARSLWVPDIFVDQAKDLRQPTFHVLPASLRVYRSGLIRYAARVNFDVACNMDFRAYPGDRQVCEVKFESFGYTSRQLSFAWSNSSNVNRNISLTQFDLSVLMQSSYDTGDYYDLSYPGLILKLYLDRKLSYHLVQSYAPSAVFLSVSWLALFVPPEQVAERLAVAMTMMLTLTTMFGSERQNVPRVSYITLLDVWMLACVLFVFLELSVFTIVLFLIHSKRDKQMLAVERAAKVALPTIFLTFNLVYWAVLLSPPKP